MAAFEEIERASENTSVLAEGIQMPLYSWDFFSHYFDSLKTSLSDTAKLRVIASENLWNKQWDFLKELNSQKTIVVTDAKLQIIFASENIFEMTGYISEEVIGKSPKMFQGEATAPADLNEIRTLISSQKPFEKTILNYKKNGETYRCAIQAFPIFNLKKELVNFIAFERAA